MISNFSSGLYDNRPVYKLGFITINPAYRNLFHFHTSDHLVPFLPVVVEGEFELLCRYLALPLDISEILNFDSNPVMKELIHGLCSKPSIKEPAKQLR